MEIGTNSKVAGQVGVSAQHSNNVSQVSGKNEAADSSQVVQRDFQVDVNDDLKSKLADFANLLQNREKLMKSLPEEVRKAVAEILQGMSPDAELPQGLASLLKGQKNMAEQLKNIGIILDFAALLKKGEHSEVKAFLSKILENFTKQAGTTPQQSASELLQLVKQLPVGTAVLQGNAKQAQQLLQQTLPEGIQPFSANEQKNIAQLTALLGKNMPAELRQLGQKSDLTELPKVWVALKAAEAWQFKDIQPKTLQAAADLLKQLVQEMSSEKGTTAGKMQGFAEDSAPEVSNRETALAQLGKLVKEVLPEAGSKATVLVRLEQFLKTLPPEIGKALELALKQGNIPENLGRLADQCSNAALLNEKMTSGLQSFLGKMAEKLAVHSPLMPASAEQIVTQFAQQLGRTSSTIEQLKTLMLQLKTQLSAGDPNLLESQQDVLAKLTQLFGQNIPQALQEGTVQQKLPEALKLWVLLNASAAEQWQRLDAQNLQKSAGVVKELAQSMYKSTGLSGEKQAEQSTLSFSVPLHVAEGVYYPAHIHIYHQQKNNSNEPTEREFETWLRVCVDTENIGMVESVFRLYGDNNLCVRVNVPDTFAADQFHQDLNKVRTNIGDTKLNLTDITVNKV